MAATYVTAALPLVVVSRATCHPEQDWWTRGPLALTRTQGTAALDTEG